ncbi:hypothetical protein WG66_003505 [Moniliophthora roreri]|nr:hypothetical protein WG66_003505 [Moniliophthora roreri]
MNSLTLWWTVRGIKDWLALPKRCLGERAQVQLTTKVGDIESHMGSQLTSIIVSNDAQLPSTVVPKVSLEVFEAFSRIPTSEEFSD